MISIFLTQTVTEAAQTNDTLETVFIVLGVVSALLFVVSNVLKKNQKLKSTLGTIAICGLMFALSGLVVEIIKDAAAEDSVVSDSDHVNSQKL